MRRSGWARTTSRRGLKTAAIISSLVVLVIGVGLFAGGLYVLVRKNSTPKSDLLEPTDTRSPAKSNVAASDMPGGRDNFESDRQSKTSQDPYVFGESEKKLSDWLERVRQEQGQEGLAKISDEQIIAIMGQPTVREKPFVDRRSGQPRTVYQARWIKKQGGQVRHTLITFVDGKFFHIVSTETEGTTFEGTDGASDLSQVTKQGNSTTDRLPSSPTQLIVGSWICEVPRNYRPNRRQVYQLRLEFQKNGTCSFEEYGERGGSLGRGQGTWSVQKHEGNSLWIDLSIDIPISSEEGWAMNRSQLFVFRTKDQWETRGLLRDTVTVFRRH
jgi:hypothetical protein